MSLNPVIKELMEKRDQAWSVRIFLIYFDLFHSCGKRQNLLFLKLWHIVPHLLTQFENVGSMNFPLDLKQDKPLDMELNYPLLRNHYELLFSV